MAALTGEQVDTTPLLEGYPQELTTIELEQVDGKHRLKCGPKVISQLVLNDSFDVRIINQEQQIITFHCRQLPSRHSKQIKWQCKHDAQQPKVCGFGIVDPNAKITKVVKETLEFPEATHFFAAILNGKDNTQNEKNVERVTRFLSRPINLMVKTSPSNFSESVRQKKGVVLHRGGESLVVDGVTYKGFLSMGQSALHLAVHADNPKLIKILIDAGADKNAQNDLNLTPLELAVYSGHPYCIEALFDAGVIIDKASGHKLLNVALQCSFKSYSNRLDESAELLIKAGADINGIDEAGYSVLMRCIEQDDKAGTIFILKQGADPAVCGIDGHSAISFMLEQNLKRSPSVGLYLFTEHYKDEPYDMNGGAFKIAFAYAAKKGAVRDLDFLIEKGTLQTEITGVAFPSKELLIAAENGQCEACKILLNDWFDKHETVNVSSESSEEKNKFERLLQKKEMEGVLEVYKEKAKLL
ncbi:ankyrin repeat domain-containing protein [Parashewanella curva]|uniref:Ankyrin repeat domain-containing protein n=1 Tax=Parashewanella curva TaxID=2338552 RepID=A0A3L8Q3C0_9GAMM|nr:ankyrin repeat domain-containing protein [Parashewanella curva]RLV61678.1 ankyrin repeat domain-containing protein [Parashewanella curva]